MGRAVTIASQKGGVGKTTTAVNLASTLCLGGRKVLLIDLDPQGNASSGVGFHRSPTSAKTGSTARQSFLGAVIEGRSLESWVCKSAFENLSVISASPELSDLELIQELHTSALVNFQRQVQTLCQKHDYVLLDCPPSLGGLPTIALSVSDAVLVPIQCEYYAMEGLSQILPVIRDLQKTTNPRLEILGLLLTMYSHELDLSHDVVDEVRSYFQGIVFNTIIPRDVVLAEAASHGIPAFHYEATSRGAWSYIELTKEVLAHDHA